MDISLYEVEVRLLRISGYYVDIWLCDPYQAKRHPIYSAYSIYIYSDWCASTEHTMMCMYMVHTFVQVVRLSEYVVSRFCQLLIRKYHG